MLCKIQDFVESFQDTIQILKWRRLSCIEDWKFLHHHWRQIFPWIILPINRLQTWDLILFWHQFRWYVEHLLKCKICDNCNGITNDLEIVSQEYRWFHCYSHEHSPNHGKFFSIFCNIGNSFLPFRTWSFIRFTNDLDSTDNSNSVSSFPMTNCWGLTFSWELIPSKRLDLSQSISSFFTDCAVPSRRISSWSGRTFRTILQEFLSGHPDRPYSCPLLQKPSTVVIQFWITCWKKKLYMNCSWQWWSEASN